MNFPILKSQNTSLIDFIIYWSRLYNYTNEELYDNCIIKNTYAEDDIRSMFIWKNGMKLSIGKQKSLEEKIISKISYINNLKSQPSWSIESLNTEFKNVSFVWRIFVLHIIKPYEIPIYDQNVHRTYNFIHYKDIINVSEQLTGTVKESFYFDEYYPFIKSIEGTTLRQIDKAFFTFGQFINSQNYLKLIQ